MTNIAISRIFYTINVLIAVPDWLVIWITGIAVWILCLCFNRKKYGYAMMKKSVLLSFLFMYLIFILFMTLLGRTQTDTAQAKWIPLWTWYRVIRFHDMAMFEELLLNIVFFVPLGILLCLLMKMNKKQAFMCGLFLSGMIEVLQYVTHRGLFEWDDMLHNAVGCALGVVIVNKIVLKIKPDI